MTLGVLELSVLTLNVWGIPYISDDRESRIRAIAHELRKGHYDVVALQEVWSEQDYKTIKKETECVLPCSHYFYSGVVGAGICVFSKYPIVATIFHAWPVNGYFYRIQHGDWFGGKGVALCRILVKNQIVNIYNAHLHAEYDSKNDDYKTHRAIQAFDTAQFMQATRGKSILQILAGDLNSQPNDICYRIILHASKMSDCCPYDDIGTNECVRNSYSKSEAVKINPVGLRIDHIFARTKKPFSIFVDEYKLSFPERVPDHKFSFSDHEAVFVKLRIVDTKLIQENELTSNDTLEHFQLESKKENEDKAFIEALQECIILCDKSIKKLETDRVLYYSSTVFLTLLLVLLIDCSVPYGLGTLSIFFKFLLFALLMFSIFMASIWNYMERNGILSAKHSMEIALKSLQEYPISKE